MFLGEPIAVGRTAEIYAWEDGQVLKLFLDWVPENSAQYEARIARAVHAAGLPVPAVGELIEVEGRRGLVYERVEGVSMAAALRDRPWTVGRSGRTLAEIASQTHAQGGIEGLPRSRDRLQRKIQGARGLSAALKQAALTALERMPEGDRLCHGDLHPENVLLTADGPVVIDWVDATVGRPLADVARSVVVLQGVFATREAATLPVRVIVRWFVRVYLRRYLSLNPGGWTEYRAWLPIVAAARMSEGIGEIEGWLRSRVELGLR